MESILLDIPYKSQIDNQIRPSGTCNTTCVAMVLEFLKAKRRKQKGQFEDEITQFMIDRGLNRQSPEDMAQVIRHYGCKDYFSSRAQIEEVITWLSQGWPVIIHGWFTDSGHIVVGCGFDKNGLRIHDPWGEWFAWGYRNDLSGEAIHMSWDLIRRTCQTDNQFWVHFVSK